MSEKAYSLVILIEFPEQVYLFRVPSDHPSLPGLRLAAKNKAMVNYGDPSKEDQDAILSTFYPENKDDLCDTLPSILESFKVDSWHIQDSVNETIMVGMGI